MNADNIEISEIVIGAAMKGSPHRLYLRSLRNLRFNSEPSIPNLFNRR